MSFYLRNFYFSKQHPLNGDLEQYGIHLKKLANTFFDMWKT